MNFHAILVLVFFVVVMPLVFGLAALLLSNANRSPRGVGRQSPRTKKDLAA